MPEPLLSPGDTIALISPASPVTPAEIAPGKKWLEELGYTVLESPTLYDSERFLAGDDLSRAQEFMAAWCDSSIDGIIAVRGGYGSQRILPYLDWSVIPQQVKPFFGFSDITALQLALLARGNCATYSGFTLAGDYGKNHTAIEAALKGEFYNEKPLVAGCLSLLNSLLGTPWFPSLTKRWLLIEETGEQPYAVDRMLSSLDLAGCFQNSAGVMFGEFHRCESKDGRDGDIARVLDEWSARIACYDKEVIREVPYGHGAFSEVTPRGIFKIG